MNDTIWDMSQFDMSTDMSTDLDRKLETLQSSLNRRINNRRTVCLSDPSEAFQLTTTEKLHGERPGPPLLRLIGTLLERH